MPNWKEEQQLTQRRGDYGYDAPYALVAFAVLGAACEVVAIVALWGHRRPLAGVIGSYGATCAAKIASSTRTTRTIAPVTAPGLRLSRRSASPGR